MSNQADKIIEEALAEVRRDLADLVKDEARSVVQELRKGPPMEPPAAGAGPVPAEESPADPGEGPGGMEPDGDEGQDPSGEGQPSIDDIKAQAMQMPPEMVALYAQAFSEALDEMQGGQDPGMGGGAPGGPGGGPPPSEESAAKSETAALGAALRKTQQQVAALVELVQRQNARPRQNAFTGNPADGKLAKREPEKPALTKDVITAKLLAKSQDPSLDLNSRKRINRYYMDPTVGFDKIADLLQ